MTRKNAENSQTVARLMADTESRVGGANQALVQMVASMSEIEASSDKVARIIKVIDEIAFQTNILALNAAVEAARAGEAGRGFAVVAEEVRNLALRSKEAAKKTEVLIKGSVQLAQNGEGICRQVNANLDEIVASVGKVTTVVGEITKASDEQARGIAQVSQAVAEMDKVTQDNAASSEESASAAEELSGQAQDLGALVQQFRLRRAAARPPAPVRAPVRAPAPAPRRITKTAPAAARGKANGNGHSNGHSNGNGYSAEALFPLEGDEKLGEF